MAASAIQTNYKGYRFRSRLEARWAVFFDALSLDWEYETEGFELQSGEWYLPDFFFPQIGMYGEVKPNHDREECERAAKKCGQLAQATRKPVLLLFGVPTHAGVWAADCNFHMGIDCDGPMDYAFSGEKYWETEGRLFACTGLSDNYPFPFACFDDDVKRAVSASRSARFEHGQNGAPV